MMNYYEKCKVHIFILLLITLFNYACSFSKKAKESEHIKLVGDSSHELVEVFIYPGPKDGLKQLGTLLQTFSTDTLTEKEYTIQLYDVTKNSLKVNLLLKDSLISSIIFDGKYKRGFFRSTTKWKILFPLPPLLWEWRAETVYFGLTANKDLLVINNSRSSGFFVILPINPRSSREDILKVLIRK